MKKGAAMQVSRGSVVNGLARFGRAAVLTALAALAALAASVTLPAQSPAYVPKQSDRPSPIDGDEPGFTPIFDGQSLKGWDGDPTYSRVEGGALVGEITSSTVVKSNTFVIWRGGRP